MALAWLCRIAACFTRANRHRSAMRRQAEAHRTVVDVMYNLKHGHPLIGNSLVLVYVFRDVFEVGLGQL